MRVFMYSVLNPYFCLVQFQLIDLKKEDKYAEELL